MEPPRHANVIHVDNIKEYPDSCSNRLYFFVYAVAVCTYFYRYMYISLAPDALVSGLVMC